MLRRRLGKGRHWKGITVGIASTLIVRVTTPEFKKVIVDTSDGRRFHADLSALSGVYCFPKNESEWSQVAPDSFGSALIWTCRFEAHIDQIIGLAFKTESDEINGLK